MPLPLTPLTKLDAVNDMLSSIGQAPVNSLDVAGIRDVSIATRALDRVTHEVLAKGWTFNSDYGYELTPDGNDNIVVPNNALWVDASDRNRDICIRDNNGTLMLYDRETNAFTFTDNPLKVDIIWSTEFEQLPAVARVYISTRASRIFQSQVIGSDTLFKYTEIHEQEAWQLLIKKERQRKRRNVLAANVSTNRIFWRSQ